MTKICTVPPTELAVSLARTKKNLRVDGAYMDDIITGWLQGIIAKTEHETGQCFMAQTWEVRLNAFPASIALPHPVLAVTSVAYVDVDGADQALAPSAYKLVAARYESSLVPARGATWPATSPEPHAVIVTVMCGYGETPEKTPANVATYLLAKLADQFDPNTQKEKETAPSPFLERLLDACRSRA